MDWLIIIDGTTQALAYLGLLALGSMITVAALLVWFYVTDMIINYIKKHN